jgi:pimeloyl-ACP methyl ester carboxylesterase
MKTVLFVPGFRESIDDRDYRGVMAAIGQKGYIVKFVPVEWTRTTIKDWVRMLDEEYVKYDPADTILAGFSYGSLTAFMSATKRNPSELWLFSFSPYFADDMRKMKKSWLKEIGKHRARSFGELEFSKLAEQIKCKTLIIVGEKEIKKYPLIGNRSVVANHSIKNSHMVIVNGSDHDVTDKRYVETIQRLI